MVCRVGVCRGCGLCGVQSWCGLCEFDKDWPKTMRKSVDVQASLTHRQAQSRCHRIGQNKTVKVYRLVTRNSYEREMFDRYVLCIGVRVSSWQWCTVG